MARPDNYIVALYVEVANIHLTIVGVVFATIWASEGRWADTNQLKQNRARANHLSAIRLGSMPASKTLLSQEDSGIFESSDTHDVTTYHSGPTAMTSRSFVDPPSPVLEMKNGELRGSDQHIRA